MSVFLAQTEVMWKKIKNNRPRMNLETVTVIFSAIRGVMLRCIRSRYFPQRSMELKTIKTHDDNDNVPSKAMMFFFFCGKFFFCKICLNC